MANDYDQSLLEWLSREEFSQYGECHGPALDKLVELGLAQIHERGNQSGFIAQGGGGMYRAVSLTDAGLQVLKGRGV